MSDFIDEDELAKSAAPIPDNSSKPTRGRPKVVREDPIDDPTVWVKCVSHDKPWTDKEPLLFWKDYKIETEVAILMESRNQVVILKEPKGDE